MEFRKATSLSGEITIPGDKSISHRGIMFGAIAKGTTEIVNFLRGADCLSTISCFQALGISIQQQGETILVQGKGLHGLSKPNKCLDVGNSGTTTRLISGILAGQDFETELTGDASIQKRPMKRIMDPLSKMGASIHSIKGNDCAPLHITGSPLHGISYSSPVASAQVKSSILLAGLYAQGETSVTEPFLSRNHSEVMLSAFGASIQSKGTTATILPVKELYAQKITVPGDISSAVYFIVAGLIIPNSEITIKNVGINPTRDGILTVCTAMGGNLTLTNQTLQGGELTADITVKTSSLHGTTIEGGIISRLIDELPTMALLACFATGDTVIKDAAELKVKESNRITVMVDNLTAMGANVEETSDGMIIHGGKPLHGAIIDSHLDHRIAMTFTVAGLCTQGVTTIKGSECVNISYPNFYDDLASLQNK